ncbi:hypothetical protein I2750_13610 [Bacillus sp. PR5]|uniref:hypothetical protein n=1 Tax=Bacillus cereus TaxID=1396 RepID=UPI000BF76D52|nr:hypothetical protein [Bacillus cereus]MBJ6721275.1 hypothetical protein [Bacillus sp. PR5]MCU5081625.1 hypothetical protein [Bacillus cereus]MEB9973481.1 hypothetical protein [Bacillus cereus]PFI81136.1 hypothetical protein COI83_15185 [Bacillus cereus]
MDSDIVVAIIGGVITFAVGAVSALAGYKGAINGAKIQIEKAQNDALATKKEEEKLARRFIESFLYIEISDNLEIISHETVQAFKNQADGTLVGGYIINTFDFEDDIYNEVKAQLNKIDDLLFVADIMSIYQCFRKINRVHKIHDLKSEEAKEIYSMLNKWINKLSVSTSN